GSGTLSGILLFGLPPFARLTAFIPILLPTLSFPLVKSKVSRGAHGIKRKSSRGSKFSPISLRTVLQSLGFMSLDTTIMHFVRRSCPVPQRASMAFIPFFGYLSSTETTRRL